MGSKGKKDGEHKEAYQIRREEMRQRVRMYGFKGMYDHEILEVMLYSFIRGEDTNPIAHALINRFGSLRSVLHAPKGALAETAGIGEWTAVNLKILGYFTDEYIKRRSKPEKFMLGSEKTNEYLHDQFIGERRQLMYMFCLDGSKRQIAKVKIGEGNTDYLQLDINSTARKALMYDSAYVVIAFNHTSGILKPSKSDLIGTAKLQDVFRVLSIRLLDSVVVTNDGIYGILSKYREIDGIAERSGLLDEPAPDIAWDEEKN